jgi:spermidine synthase
MLLATGLGILLSPWAYRIQSWLNLRKWPGQKVVYSENSVYGNVAVVQQEGQYTFYADGIPVLTAPVPDLVLSEEVVHLPMLFVPQPRDALVLSGGVGGVLHELAKYPLERIDYAELDPLLIEAVERFPTPLTMGELADPRVGVENVDGRLLVRRKVRGIDPVPGQGYDLVIVNLPYPSTLQLNRFYTAEFYLMVRQVLSEEGVLVVRCPGTLSYMSEELRDLNASAYRTLGEAFPYVRAIPGDVTLWLASPSDQLVTASLGTLVERWEERDLPTQLLTPSHIHLRLSERRSNWFWAALALDDRGRAAQVNRDLHPVGLLYGLSYWNALFSDRPSTALASLSRLNPWYLAVPLAAGALLCAALAARTVSGRRFAVPVVIAATGFSGMAADLIVVFAFQSFYGHVYHSIGLLITAFMAGLSLGGFLMTRWSRRAAGDEPTFIRLELVIVFYWFLLAIALHGLSSRLAGSTPSAAIQAALLLTNAVAGFLVGAQFPVANRIWLRSADRPRGTTGTLYACDLVGAFVASIEVPVVLIPVLGMIGLCFLLAALKLASLLLVVGRNPSTKLPASSLRSGRD